MNSWSDENAVHYDNNDFNQKEKSGKNFPVSLVGAHFGGYKFY
jgi:hypothetical protein